MNCQDFSQLIVTLTCDLPLEASERARALAHANVCHYCQAHLTRQESLAATLQSLAQQEQIINAPEHIGQQLLAAFEQQKQPVAGTVATPVRRGFWTGFRLNWALAATATVLLLFALSPLWWGPEPVRQTNLTQELHPELALQQAASAPATTTPVPLERTASPRAVVRAAFKARARSAPSAVHSVRYGSVRHSEDGKGEFLALRPNLSAEPSEFEQIVRMQIPRTTLALWGVRVNEDSDNPKVHAEVVFGEDGVARAIRILN